MKIHSKSFLGLIFRKNFLFPALIISLLLSFTVCGGEDENDKITDIIGTTGPGGGIIYHVEGNTYYEVSPIFPSDRWLNATNTVSKYRGGGYANWRLPTKNELNLVYANLHISGKKDLGDSWHWSSLVDKTGCNSYWALRFSDGKEGWFEDSNLFCLRTNHQFRAVRDFNP